MNYYKDLKEFPRNHKQEESLDSGKTGLKLSSTILFIFLFLHCFNFSLFYFSFESFGFSGPHGRVTFYFFFVMTRLIGENIVSYFILIWIFLISEGEHIFLFIFIFLFAVISKLPLYLPYVWGDRSTHNFNFFIGTLCF